MPLICVISGRRVWWPHANRRRDDVRRPCRTLLCAAVRDGADGGPADRVSGGLRSTEQSISELAEALLASRSAIAGAVNTLESLGLIRRYRAAGERMDRVWIDMSSPNAMGFDISEYREHGELAREGLLLLGDVPAERQELLLEWAAFADFLVERIPVLAQEWEERRAALLASGALTGGRGE